MIQEMVRQLAGKAEVPGVNPDECVAMGSALAGVLRHQPKHPALRSVRKALARRARENKEGKASGTTPAPPTEPPPEPAAETAAEAEAEAESAAGPALSLIHI